LLAVFIGGLMVGRTPELLGKKIEAREIKLASVGILITPLTALISTALAIADPAGRVSIFNSGPQGFSETSTPICRNPTTTVRRSPATPASSSRPRATLVPWHHVRRPARQLRLGLCPLRADPVCAGSRGVAGR